MIEARLGLRMEDRHHRDYYKRTNEGGFTQPHYQTLTQTESGESLLDQVNRWLERMPFFKKEYWTSYPGQSFWDDYATLYRQSLTEKEAGKWEEFQAFFFPKDKPATSLSPEALRSALFIMLFRDFPVFQTSYQVLDALIEIDHWMAGWRHKHLTMVRRMIGMRVGTGNTTGAGYLEGALSGHYVYRDLAGLSTYLIERRKLPKLPVELIRHLSFNT
jgi:tryptophan 2,3-dioxygenase